MSEIQVEPDEADVTRLAIGQRDEARDERDKAYRERAALVAYLTAVYPAEITQDDSDEGWWIVYASTPSGQMSWHIADADRDLLAHVREGSAVTWDGHTTGEKYRRLRELTRTVATGIYGPQPTADLADDEYRLTAAGKARADAETAGPWPCCEHCIDGDGMLPCGDVHGEPCGTGDCGLVTDAELAEWRKGLQP